MSVLRILILVINCDYELWASRAQYEGRTLRFTGVMGGKDHDLLRTAKKKKNADIKQQVVRGVGERGGGVLLN